MMTDSEAPLEPETPAGPPYHHSHRRRWRMLNKNQYETLVTERGSSGGETEEGKDTKGGGMYNDNGSKREKPEIFHPSILFCGECSSCAPPPPPTVFDSKAEDKYGNVEMGSMENGHKNNSEPQDNDGESLHLRVYNLDPTGGRRKILENIMNDLDGVKSVNVSDSHVSYHDHHHHHHCDSSSCKEHVLEASSDGIIDPTSCMLQIQYLSEFNPQEPKTSSTNGDSTVVGAIETRLREAGFDFATLSNATNECNTCDCNHHSHSDGSSFICSDISTPSPNATLHVDNKNHVCHSNRVHHHHKHTEPPPSCRSRLHVQGICCSSEIPAVRAILKPLPGVRKVGINVATKVVFVDHDPSIITADLLMKALNEDRFGATIVRDGELDLVDSRGGGHCSSKKDCDCHQNSCGDQSHDPSSSSFGSNLQDMPRSRFVESTIFIQGMVTLTNKEDLRPIEKLMQQNFFRGQLRAYHLHAPSRTLKAEHDPRLLSAEKIRSVLVKGLQGEEWGTIELAHDGAVENLALPMLTTEDDGDEVDATDDKSGSWLHGLKITVVLSGVCWILSLLSCIGGYWNYLKYAGIGSIVFGMPPVVIKAWMTARRLQFDANCMMVTAAFGALLLGEFDEAASVAFLFSISELLEARATVKARDALGAIVSLRPDYANMVDSKTGGVVIVPAAKVPVGSLVSVRTGDKVPADGVVHEGTSAVDESSITGEARPVDKRAGDEVTAGSINVGSTQLVVRTTATVGDSTLSRLIQLVEEAQANRSETEKLVDSFARKYTPIVLLVAFFLCTVPWVFGEEVGRYWALNGLIIVVIACPCALTISTPVTYSAGLAATAQRGIIIKGGSRLEALGNVKTVVLDKTGTITNGTFSLLHLDVIDNSITRSRLLELLAIMEGPSSHPLSATLVSAAKTAGVAISDDTTVKEHTILKGEGVTAIVKQGSESSRVYVGNERLFKRLGMFDLPEESINSANQWSNEGGTVGFIGIEEVGIVGTFCVADTVREEAHDVVSTLMAGGIEVVMLTGDGEGAAQAVGREIGLAKGNIHSRLLPEDKLHHVSGLKQSSTPEASSFCGRKGLVLMVGDGVNDALALSVADIGVAMGEGAALAMEMSDVTLMDSNLSKLLFSMRMGNKVKRTVKENIIFSCVVNAIAIGLTLAGKMSLLLAIASDVGVMLLVTMNGMKLLSRRTIDSIEVNRKESLSKKKLGHMYDFQPDEEINLEIV